MNDEQNPQVSIITCFLNVEAYLEESIESILSQTFRNWELLLIDDGSADNSTLIAKKYCAENPGKVFYMDHAEHENKGLSFSRNVGVNHARGGLLAFLDGDDVWMPSYLAQIIKCWQEQDAAMVCQASIYWHSWNGNNKKDFTVNVGVEQNKTYHPPELLKRLYPVGSGAAPCICGLLIEKQALIACGGFENSFQGMYEDQALLVKLYKREKVYISSSCYNKYRQRQSSLVYLSRMQGSYEGERKRFLYWLKTYFLVKGWLTKDVKKIVARALMPYEYPSFYFLRHSLVKKANRWVKQKIF